MAREHRHHAHEPVFDHERIACEGDHSFLPGPHLVAHTRIALDGVGQMRMAFLSNQPDLVLADRNPTVRAVEVRVQPGAGPKFQHVILGIERPDAGEGPVQMPHHRLSAVVQHFGERVALRKAQTHVFNEDGELDLLLGGVLIPLPLRPVAHDLGETPELSAFVPQGGQRPPAPEARAVLADVPAVVVSLALLQRLLQLPLRKAFLNVFWGKEDGNRLPDHFFFPITQQPLGAWVPAFRPALGVDDEDGVVRDILDQQAKEFAVGFLPAFPLCRWHNRQFCCESLSRLTPAESCILREGGI